MTNSAGARRATLLKNGHHFVWRSATPDDAAMVWSWWNGPHVVYWGVDQRLAKVAPPPHDERAVGSYLEMSVGERGVDPIIGMIDGTTAVVYAELYSKGSSPLVSSPLVEDEARGMHMLWGPVRERRRATAFEISVDAVDWQFQEYPSTETCIADPDVRNKAVQLLCERLGMTELGIVQLPHKAARLFAVTRESWTNNRQHIDSLLR